MMLSEPQPTCRRVVGWATDWSEGVLGPEENGLVAEHLEECAECRLFFRQMEATRDLTRQWASAEPSDPKRKQEVLAMFLAPEGNRTGSRTRSGQSSPDASQRPEADGSRCPELDETTARAYLEDRLPAEQQIAVLEHLISGCEPCRLACVEIAFPELGGELPERVSMREEPPPPEIEKRYREELEHLLRESGRGRETRLSEDLEPRPFLLWLIRQGRDLTESEPPKSVAVASIAVSIARDLDLDSGVRAAMFKGMVVRKVEGDFLAAERWFAWADRQAEADQELSGLRPKILSLWGFSKWCQSMSVDALDLFRTALDMYRARGDIARWGECVIDTVAPLQELDPDKAVQRLLESSCVIDWQGRSRLAAALTQYLSYSYLVLGKPHRALLALEPCRQYLEGFDAGRSVQLRIDWTEASILNALGVYGEGARRLRDIRQEFLELDLPANAAFVSLDLAVSLIGLGRWEELAEVAGPMAAVFISRGISGEAAMALSLFQRAAARRTLKIAQVHAVRQRLVWP